jgi:ABC-type spermidine/putrescine transport system permease subunit I
MRRKTFWASLITTLIAYYFRYRLLNYLLRNDSMRKTLVSMVMIIPFVRQRMVMQLFSNKDK